MIVFKIIFPFLILFAASRVSAQTFSGIVVDGNGAPIDAASVVLFEGNFQRSKTETDGEGRFSFPAVIGMRSRLSVTAKGFAPFERDLKNDGVRDFTIVLRPAAVGAEVTVSITRTETRLSETPASVVVLSREQLDASASQSIDDSLRQIAGFSLFRRSSSKTTNPTAQGANLRGVSGSGASRASV
ncbi:MAG: carboxypeptidase regulatory-like domain-containing protein, partial [Acidobacteriota bacterium]